MKGELLGFTLGEHHSSEFNMVRTTKGMDSINLFGKFQDSTVLIPNSDITLFYQSTFQSKSFSMAAAFVNLTEQQLIQLKHIWNNESMYPLIFDEAPHKYYMVKIDKMNTLKFLSFEDSNGRFYNGEVTFSFISYFPYALSRFSSLEDESIKDLPIELKNFWENLGDIPNAEPEWIKDEDNKEWHLQVSNQGDLPALFKLWLNLMTPTYEDKGITILGKKLKFDIMLSSKANEIETEMELIGVEQNSTVKDDQICIDCFRGTIMGYKDSKKSNILYNGTMRKNFIIIPPHSASEIVLKLDNANAFDGNGNVVSDFVVTLNDLNPQYEISYVYRE